MDFGAHVTRPQDKSLQVRCFIVQKLAHLDQEDLGQAIGRVIPKRVVGPAPGEKGDVIDPSVPAQGIECL